MADLKTTAEERVALQKYLRARTCDFGLNSRDALRILDDLDTLLAEVERLRAGHAALWSAAEYALDKFGDDYSGRLGPLREAMGYGND